MARPKEKTVQYFSHDCTHGKTLFILEQRFGNDGYAFWFKLLETLGSTENHYIIYDNPQSREFLHVLTKSSEETAIKILDLCALLGAIDAELWKDRIIWSDNFISRIADVYRNRRVDTPIKPVSTIRNTSKESLIILPTPKSTQSKVKESKVNSLIRIGNDNFDQKPSEIAKEQFPSRLGAVLSSSLRDMDQIKLFEEFDKEYASYEFSDVNHFFNALKVIGTKIKNPAKKFTGKKQEIDIDNIDHGSKTTEGSSTEAAESAK